MHSIIHQSRRWQTGAWLLFFAVIAFAFWGSRPLWEPDEGRYGEVAREMAVGGDWLVPHIQGHPHLTKPPLTYWLGALGLRLFGTSAAQPIGSAWGARWYVALAFFGTILCTVALARCWGWSRRGAWMAGAIFATSLLPYACGNIISTDVLLLFWETLGVLCAWRVWRGPGNAAVWRAGFWIAFGLAFLTKGPPGLLPWLAMVLFIALRRPLRPAARLWSAWGVLGFLVLAGWWYAVLIGRERELVVYFLRDEVFNRVFTKEHGRTQPVWFYGMVLGLGMMPWAWLWPDLAGGVVRRLWPGRLAPRAWMQAAGQRLRALDDPALFSLLWFAVPLTVFQISSSKMYLYVVPLCVPLAIWFARGWMRRFPAGWPSTRGGRAAAIVLAGLWLAGMMSFRLIPERYSFDRSHRALAAEILKNPPSADRRLWTFSVEPHSISFYTGLLLQDAPGESSGPTLRALKEAAQQGEVRLLTNGNGLDKMADKQVPWSVIARQGDLIYLRVLPEPQPARGSE